MGRFRRFRLVPMVMVGPLALGTFGCSNGGAARAKAPALGDSSIASVKVVTTTGPDTEPIDAAPSPDATVIYFTTSGTGGPALVKVPAAGGATSTLLAGAPLVKPVGVAVATDGSRVFVADPAAGRIFSVPSEGGMVTVVAGSEGRSPRGLDVTVANGSDVVYFTGTDPADGAAGLFSVPASGGGVKVVAKGAPLLSPDSVVIAGAGLAYVTDRGAGPNQGAVLKVSGSSATRVAAARLGDPGGVSLTGDGKTLMVSSLNTATGADQLLLVDLATGTTGTASKVIGSHQNTSGGLHRAYRVPGFAWADVSRSGRVYRVDPG